MTSRIDYQNDTECAERQHLRGRCSRKCQLLRAGHMLLTSKCIYKTLVPYSENKIHQPLNLFNHFMISKQIPPTLGILGGPLQRHLDDQQ
jgi:hypothetical protein